MARKCTQFGRGKGGKRVCRKFSGSKALSSASKKGTCLKWSKGRTKCLRRGN